MSNTGARIKKIRLMLKKSQQNLADELNVTKQAISNIETGKCSPSPQLLSKLLIDYGVNINFIIGEVGSVFIEDEKCTQSLKNQILKEVENMLIERGID